MQEDGEKTGDRLHHHSQTQPSLLGRALPWEMAVGELPPSELFRSCRNLPLQTSAAEWWVRFSFFLQGDVQN